MIGMPNATFWQTPLADLTRQLDANANGLSSVEAAARLKRYGANTAGGPTPLLAAAQDFEPVPQSAGVDIARRGHNLRVYRRYCQPDNHFDYGAVQCSARQRAGVPGRTGRRSTKDLGGAERTGSARWPGDYRSRRSDSFPATSSCSPPETGAGRRQAHRGHGISSSTRRLLTGESYPVEKQRHARWYRRTSSRAGCQCRLHGQLGRQRLGPAAALRNRRQDPTRRNQRYAPSHAASRGAGEGHLRVRHADRAADHTARSVRVAGQHVIPPAIAGELPVRHCARGRSDAGTVADDRIGDARARRAAHGQANK